MVAAVVTTPVDGDTVRVRTVRGTETVRLLGVNTPETHHPTKAVECFGPEAAAFTDRELTGRPVELELDVEHRDRYGRLLAYVIVDGRRFNDVLLETRLRAAAGDPTERRARAHDARRGARGASRARPWSLGRVLRLRPGTR